MKVLLALGVVLACSIALSSAQCLAGKLSFDRKTGTQGCQYKGQLHKIGTEWTSGCEKCQCSSTGMSCCSTIQTPIVDEKTCEKIFVKATCSYKVVKKDNPSETCEIKAMVA
ncbi:beta-microseminoprotein-like isoform X3 [Dendropsophus ebraccatus]|uniref:beta-microseminoprotein-like isoform X2 n=1 Tax=Dendropsophus ebraccatus TaxID=150705 RepID=UPI003832038E